MDDATKDYWYNYDKDTTTDTTVSKASSVEYIDFDGVHQTVGRMRRRQADKDGWSGYTYDKDKTDWGKSYTDDQYQKDPTADTAEEGYGKPSKGTYSTELGGFKTFGTLGQGDSSFGAKDLNDTTCGDRIILLSISATDDTNTTTTTTTSATTSATSLFAHPVVQRDGSLSQMVFEVGSFQFYDEVLAAGPSEEKASFMKPSWVLLSLASLLYMSMSQAI